MKGFIKIANNIVNNSDLSPEARVVLMYMLSRPKNWDYSVSGLAAGLGVNRSTMYKYLRQLTEQGYFRMESTRRTGRFMKKNFIIIGDPNRYNSESVSKIVYPNACIYKTEKYAEGFTCIPIELLNNKELRPFDKFVLVYLLYIHKNYKITIRHLAESISVGEDKVRAAFRRLIDLGYLSREKKRENGRFSSVEYRMIEKYKMERKTCEKGEMSKTHFANRTAYQADSRLDDNIPYMEVSSTKKTTGNMLDSVDSLLKNREISDAEKTTQNNKFINNNNQSNLYLLNKGNDESAGMGYQEYVRYTKKRIQERMQYNLATSSLNKNDKRLIDAVFEVYIDAIVSGAPIKAGGREYSGASVAEKFRKYEFDLIEYVFICLKNCTSKIRNIKNYIRACLWNAPISMELYYMQQARMLGV